MKMKQMESKQKQKQSRMLAPVNEEFLQITEKKAYAGWRFSSDRTGICECSL